MGFPLASVNEAYISRKSGGGIIAQEAVPLCRFIRYSTSFVRRFLFTTACQTSIDGGISMTELTFFYGLGKMDKDIGR